MVVSSILNSLCRITCYVVVGWKHIGILNSRDGIEITTTSIPCPPVNRPVVRDFTGDGVNDVTLTCHNK